MCTDRPRAELASRVTRKARQSSAFRHELGSPLAGSRGDDSMESWAAMQAPLTAWRDPSGPRVGIERRPSRQVVEMLHGLHAAGGWKRASLHRIVQI